MVAWVSVCFVCLGVINAAPAQTNPGSAPAGTNNVVFPEQTLPRQGQEPSGSSGVVQAGCSTCGGGLLGPPSGCCSPNGCVPGQLHPCSCCDANTCFGRFLCGVYECICCPDPCYEPHWVAAADAAFFVDAPRPVTQMRLRWDSDFSIQRPDRAEFFIPRENVNNNGGKGPRGIARTIDIEELSLYTETATGAFGFFVEVPYREVDFDTSGISNPIPEGSGFSDLNIGTKSLLLDCELLQIAFQFKTFIPTGDLTKGLGTGHVSLEPALLFALKLTPDMYLQAETAYWIPIGGDNLYQGNVFHAHLSLNRILCRILPDVLLIGTAEINEWSVINGNFTETDFLNAAGQAIAVRAVASMVSMGPGVRLVICDKIDFGVGSAFAVTGERWAQEQVRAEFRWRF
jgi:hypothetical protein